MTRYPLAVLVDGPVQVRPLAGHLDMRLIGEPPVTGSVPERTGGLDELEGEPLHPPVDGDVIDGDAALGQQLLHIPVGQAIAQLAADRQGDHLPWEAEASELQAVREAALPGKPAQPTSLHRMRLG
jgi:hypothetical protein